MRIPKWAESVVVIKEQGKSLIADTEIERLAGMTGELTQEQLNYIISQIPSSGITQQQIEGMI
jgi:hypothetical protein